MTTTNLLLIAAALLALACSVYIYFWAQKLYLAREERVAGKAAVPADRQPSAAGAPPVGAHSGMATPPPEVASAAGTGAPAAGESPFLRAPQGSADDLLRIKGIGPKLSQRLGELGVFHYRQIADWTPEQLALVDSQLGNFAGRPERDQWQSQARLLAAGDLKAYERAHGKLGPAAGGPAA